MSGRRWQFRIWWIMALAVVVAAAIGAVTSPLDNVALGALMTLVFGFLFVAVYILAGFLPYNLVAQRFRCPACGARMLCLLVVMFRPPLLSLHLCPGCGARLKRFPVGGWRDVTGSGFEVWFPPLVASPVEVIDDEETSVASEGI